MLEPVIATPIAHLLAVLSFFALTVPQNLVGGIKWNDDPIGIDRLEYY